MPRLFSAGVLAAVLAVAAPPAHAQSRREMQMMADIRMLQEQTQQMQQQLATALAQLGESLEQLSSRLDEQSAATRKGFADQKLIVDQVGSDLRIVKERVDETNVRVTALSQEVEALRLAIPPMPPPAIPGPTAGVDPTLAPGVPGVPGAASPPQTAEPAPPAAPLPPAPPLAAGISPQRLFETAWTDYTAGQWTLCIEGFNSYLRNYSRNEAAGDAQFYIGECHYSDGKYLEASDAYNRVITTYPRSQRAPEAYYKLGLAFERMGQPDRARQAWETLIKAYPDSDMARLAKQNLDRLARVPKV